MSLTKQVTVWCDNCAQWEMYSQETPLVAGVNKQARKEGWTAKRQVHLCPKCSESYTIIKGEVKPKI